MYAHFLNYFALNQQCNYRRISLVLKRINYFIFNLYLICTCLLFIAACTYLLFIDIYSDRCTCLLKSCLERTNHNINDIWVLCMFIYFNSTIYERVLRISMTRFIIDFSVYIEKGLCIN